MITKTEMYKGWRIEVFYKPNEGRVDEQYRGIASDGNVVGANFLNVSYYPTEELAWACMRARVDCVVVQAGKAYVAGRKSQPKDDGHGDGVTINPNREAQLESTIAGIEEYHMIAVEDRERVRCVDCGAPAVICRHCKWHVSKGTSFFNYCTECYTKATGKLLLDNLYASERVAAHRGFQWAVGGIFDSENFYAERRNLVTRDDGTKYHRRCVVWIAPDEATAERIVAEHNARLTGQKGGEVAA